MEQLLKKYGLTIRESDSPDRKPVDFTIEDGNDNVCWVWGDTPDNVKIECDHAVIDYGDDDDLRGRCLVCGAACDWHWEDDSGDVEDYHWEGKERVPHYWHEPINNRGIVKMYLRRLKGGE